MESFFLTCAGLGGTILVLQIVVGALGVGGDHDHDTDHDTGDHGSWFFGALSLRTASAALAFFGLGGMTALYYGAEEPASVGVAFGAAVAAFYAVGFVMQSLKKLKADGTARIDRAIERTGSVYLRVPGSRAGAGKVHLSIQNRTVEYQAVTAGPELPTGAAVRVVAVVNSDTVEVVAA